MADQGAIRVVDVAYVTKKEDSSIAPDTWASAIDTVWRKFGAITGALVEVGLGGIDRARIGAGQASERAGMSSVEQEFGESM